MTGADPTKLAEAQREGLITGWMARLRISRESAEAWMRAWGVEAARLGRIRPPGTTGARVSSGSALSVPREIIHDAEP